MTAPLDAGPAQPAEHPATPAHRPSASARVHSLWVNRRILRILVIRDLKIRYSDTVLGFTWTVLDPLLMTLVYWFVFGVIVARGDATEQPYLLWLLTGILPFQWTAHVMNDSGRLLGNDAKLVIASSLPREIWVLRSVTSRGLEFLFSLPITVVAAVLFAVFWSHPDTGEPLSIGWIWLLAVPVALLVQFVFNIGLSLTLAPMSMLYPDVQRVVRVFTTLYRYLSPVIYGLVTLEVALKDAGWPLWLIDLYELNPMVGILNAYHAVFFPGTVDDVVPLLAIAAGLSIALVLVGWRVFRRLEPRVLKEL
jgi:ABC-2 type transport system permease protein